MRQAKARSARPYKFHDANGLYLLVAKSGSKHWRFDYRYAGTRPTLTIGRYPLFGLRQAREARDKARVMLREGADPTERQKLERLTALINQASTFASVADELLIQMERERQSPQPLKKTRWLLDLARPIIGARPIGEMTAPEILFVLRKAEDRGRHATARRLRSLIGGVFRYAIATGRATSDLTYALRNALITPPVAHYAAITEPDEIGDLLRAIEGYDGQPTTHIALKLAPHLFVRPGELRTAEWSELDFDAARWNIPAAKTKMRRPLRVPLTPQTLALFGEI